MEWNLDVVPAGEGRGGGAGKRWGVWVDMRFAPDSGPDGQGATQGGQS